MQKLISRAMPFVALAFMASAIAQAAETPADQMNEATQDAKKTVKKSYRNAKDKTCEMVNGKMECAAKKVKHKLQNAGDEIKAETTEHK